MTLKLTVEQGSAVYSYTFLQPLFTMPLSGLMIEPINSLRICSDHFLVSATFNLNEFDFTVFGLKNTKKFKVE